MSISRAQALRSSNANTRPPVGTRQPGELYTNWPDKAFGVIDSTQHPMDLLAVRFFSPTTAYNTGDFVQQGGQLYCASVAITAGVFNPTQWAKVTLASDIGTMASQNANAVAVTGGAINGTTIGATTPSTGAFTTLSTTGAATFGGAVTVNNSLTVNSNIGCDALYINGANAILYTQDRTGTNYAYYYRTGGTATLAMSEGAGSLNLSFSSVSMAGTATVASTLTAQGGLAVTAGTPTSQGASAGWNCYDRDNAGLSSMMYGAGDIGRLWRSDVGDCFSFGPAGNCVVVGTLTVNGTSLYASALGTWGANFYSSSGYPLYIHAPNGANCYMDFVIDGVRAWYCGQGSNQYFSLFDASAGHTHFYCNPTNNHVYMNETSIVVGDFGSWGAGQFETSTVSGYVIDALAGTTNITSYTASNFDVGNGNSYLCFFTVNQRAGGVGSITTNGTSTYYNTSSDGRHKKNLRPLAKEIDVGKMIDAIEPVAFEWTNLPDEPTGHGFVAQDLAEVAPEAVWSGYKNLIDTEEFPNPWGVDFSKLVPYMVAEMQHMRKRIAELEAKHG